MSVVTKRCKSCLYYTSNNGHYVYPTCDYLLVTGKRRGCPAGDACDKYTPSEGSIRYVDARAGVVRLPVYEQQLADLYEQHKTDVSIAKELGISRKTVARWREKNGLLSWGELRKKARDED